MKRARSSVIEESSEHLARRQCTERSLWKAFETPAAVLFKHLTPELQSTLERISLDRLILKAQENMDAPPSLDGLEVSSSGACAAAKPHFKNERPPATLLPGLMRQSAYCPGLLTETALEEETESTTRCVSAIARLARRCGAVTAEA